MGYKIVMRAPRRVVAPTLMQRLHSCSAWSLRITTLFAMVLVVSMYLTAVIPHLIRIQSFVPKHIKTTTDLKICEMPQEIVSESIKFTEKTEYSQNSKTTDVFFSEQSEPQVGDVIDAPFGKSPFECTCACDDVVPVSSAALQLSDLSTRPVYGRKTIVRVQFPFIRFERVD